MTGIVDDDHWRELVAQFTSFLPPDDEASKKNMYEIQGYLILELLSYSHRVSFSLVNFRKSFDVSSSWITERFDYLDPQAEEALIDRFARVWL